MRLARAFGAAFVAVLLEGSPATAFTWPDAADRVARDLASPDAGVRKGAAERLRALTAAVATPLLLRALGDADVDVRITAAHVAIGRHVGPAAHAVIEWLGERDPRLRLAACEVLGELPDPESVPQLARALGDPEATVRAAAAAALGAQTSPAPGGAAGAKEATPALLGKLDDSSPPVRAEVVRALARLGDARAVVPLVGKAEDSVPEVRQAVARALGDLGDPRASPALVLQLRDASSDVRAAAVSALGQLRAEKAADAIAPVAADRNPLLRRVAVAALGRIGSPDAIRALVALLGTGDDAGAGLEPSPPREALVAAGPAATPALVALLAGTATPAAATGAAWVLGESRATASVPDIVRAMRRGTLPATGALHALASMGAADAVPVVLEFVDDASPAVRREALHAADALLDATRPDGRAVEPLAAALRDPALSVAERARATALLGRTGAARAAPAVVALLSAKDPDLRVAAIDALGALGPTGADLPLLAALDDADPAARLHAAIALGRAGGAAARDALVGRLSGEGVADTSATLTALGGVMSRAPSDAAVEALGRALDLAPGPDRDAVILALGRARTEAAVPRLRAVLASRNPDDRRTLATVLAARGPTAAVVAMLSALLADTDASVRGEAAWSTGEVGGPSALGALRSLIAAPDLEPAIDATAAIARITARGHAPDVAARELCPLLADRRGYLRANAAAGLALAGARCADGAAERRLLTDDSAAVRAAAAKAIVGHPLGPADAAALERCRTSDPSGSVARLCAARPRPPASGTDAVELYVEGDLGVTPQPGAPYVIELADGLLRAGRCDRRGATFDPAAPRGDVSLLGVNPAGR